MTSNFKLARGKGQLVTQKAIDFADASHAMHTRSGSKNIRDSDGDQFDVLRNVAGMPPISTGIAATPWAVRIVDQQGEVLGAGVILGEEFVVTCAHVVRASARDQTPRLDAVVRVEFVGMPTLPACDATVVEEAWFPAPADGTGDIAMLRLAHPVPPGIGAKLRRRPMTVGRKVWVAGFPGGVRDGLEAEATVRHAHGPRNEWVQLNDTLAGPNVERGYSGAGVADASGEVLGILVVVFPGKSASSMIPVETLVKYVRFPDDWLAGRPALDQSIVDHLNNAPGDGTFGREVADFLTGLGDQSILTTSMAAAPEARYAELARVLVLADRERRPGDADDAGPVPVDTVAVAVDVSGLSVDEVRRRLIDRVGPPLTDGPDQGAELPGLTIVLDGVDEAQAPEALVEQIVGPLAKRRVRLLLVFRSAGSAAESMVTEIEPDLPAFPELTAKVDQVRAAERMAWELYGRTVPEIVVDAPPPRRTAALRIELSLLRARRSQLDTTRLEQARAAFAAEADAALDAMVRAMRELRERSERREELRGRLDAYRAMAASQSRSDGAGLVSLYGKADAVLRAKPAQLDEAAVRVDDYVAAVQAGPGR